MQDILREYDVLYASIKELSKCGVAAAKAKMEYNVALAQQILVEREKGVPVTIVSDICRGDPEVARLRFNKDVSEVMYEAAKQGVITTRGKINLMQDLAKLDGVEI